MDNSFGRQESDNQQQSGLLASLQIFDRFLNWLASLIRLTEDEQREAGIYIGRERNE